MGRRKNQFRRKTVAVQGDDSFVEITLPNVREIREIQEAGDEQAFVEGIKLIVKHVVAWNWVDDDDVPLPLPKDEPAIVDTLTTSEYKCLLEALLGQDAEQKN